MASWRPHLQRGVAVFRAEPVLTVVLFLALWIPQALGWLVVRSMTRSGFQVQEVVSAALGFAIPLLIVSPAFAGGVMSLFSAAVRGSEAGWAAFREGLGRYYWRVVGAFLLFIVVSLLVTIPVGLTAARLSLPTSVAASATRPSLALLPILARDPVLIVFALGALAIHFFVLYWSPAVALGDRGVFGGIASSVRFAARRWGFTLAAVIANVVVMGLITDGVRLVSPGAAAPLDGASDPLAMAVRAMSLTAFAVTTVAALLQAIWQALYRSVLWSVYEGAGGNAGPLPEPRA